MSEFTDSALFLSRDLEAVRRLAQNHPQPHIIHTINDKWAGLFPEHGNPRDIAFARWSETTSKEVALLYFQHAEDHGWGYALYRNNRLCAWVEVSYELSWHMVMDLAEARHPGSDPIMLFERIPELFDTFSIEVERSAAYQHAVAQQFAGKTVRELQVFDMAPPVLSQIDKLLAAEVYHDEPTRHDQVYQFKRLMGFPEMEWMSYRYLSRQQ